MIKLQYSHIFESAEMICQIIIIQYQNKPGSQEHHLTYFDKPGNNLLSGNHYIMK